MTDMPRFWPSLLHRLYCRLLFPVWLLGFKVGSRFSRERPTRVGRLTICGPPTFIGLCKDSVERLASLDADKHGRLTAAQPVWVFGDNDRGERFGPPWIVIVSAAYASWQTDGVIAWLVYVAFYITAFPCPPFSREEQRRAHLKHQEVLAQTRAWLELHAFPTAIIGCFS